MRDCSRAIASRTSSLSLTVLGRSGSQERSEVLGSHPRLAQRSTMRLRTCGVSSSCQSHHAGHRIRGCLYHQCAPAKTSTDRDEVRGSCTFKRCERCSSPTDSSAPPGYRAGDHSRRLAERDERDRSANSMTSNGLGIQAVGRNARVFHGWWIAKCDEGIDFA